MDNSQLAKEACEIILDFAPQEDVDDYARKQLNSEFKKRHIVKKPIIAKLEFVVNNHIAPNLLDAIIRVGELEEFGVNFTGMPLEPIWEYDTPARRLKASSSGKGGVFYFPKKRVPSGVGWDPLGDPTLEKAMLMIYTSKWFIPENIKSVTQRPHDIPPPTPPQILPPHEWWKAVRETGFVPFEIVVCAYTQQKRFMYTLDLINNVAFRDFRMGTFSRKREDRTVLDFMYLDTAISCNALKELQKKCFLYIFDVDKVTPQEIAFGFQITEKMARNILGGMVKKGILFMEGSAPGESYSTDILSLREMKGQIKP